MKFKKLLLVSIFLLTILTIGAASAAENTTDSGMLDAANDVTLDSTDTSDVLSEGYYYDSDFYIYVQEDFTHGKRDWNSYDLVSIHSYSEKNSTIDILVDGAEKKSINATDGYFSIEIDENGTVHKIFSTFVYPNDLGITPGSHNIKVNVNGNTRIDTPVSINEMEDFTIWLQNPYYSEKEYWPYSSFIVIDSNNLNNGTLEIYVNGTRKLTYSVANGLFEEIENCSSKSRYVLPYELFNDYGNYNIQIKFTENGVTKTLKDENVVVAEFEPTTNPQLEIYFDFYTLIIPADNVAHIYLPREATGNLTISYNNVRNNTVNYNKGYGEVYINSWDLNHLGENEITVTYIGDDFGTLTKTATVLVLPDITCPGYVLVGEEFNISVFTFGWVNGNFSVYEYNDGVKGKLLASNEIKEHSHGDHAKTTVNLSCEKSGLNKLYLDYYDIGAGHYPIIQEVYVIQNSENVKVDVPSEVEIGKEFNVTVNAPDIDFTFAQISVDGGDVQFVMFENGVAKQNISNLTAGYHTVKVFYENQYYSNGEWLRDVYLDTFTVNVATKTNLTASDVAMDFNSTGILLITLKDENNTALSGKDIKVNIDNQEYNATTGDGGQAVLPIAGLSAGKFTALICFEGSEGYLSSNATSQVAVNKINTSLEANNVTMYYGDDDVFVITLKDANSNLLADKEITIYLDGKKSTLTTNASGQASFDLNLDVTVYTAEINFAGDNNYLGSKILSKITVNKAKTQFNASDITVTVGTSNDVAIALTDIHGVGLANKKIIAYIKSLNDMTTDGNGIVHLTINLTGGTYDSFIYFNGDSNYESIKANFKVSVVKSNTQLVASDVTATYGEVKNLTVTLKDAQGVALANKVISIKLNNANYTRTTDANGAVSLPIVLDAGKYDAQISFAGDSSYFSSVTVSKIIVSKVTTQITAPAISTTYNIGKNLVITLKTSDGKALTDKNIVVALNNKLYEKTTDSNGQVVISSYNMVPKSYYIASVIFYGDSNYVGSNVNAKVVVNKALPKITASNKAYKVKVKTKQYTITLKNNKNAVLKSKSVTLKVSGKTYKATTNSKGKATFKITKLTKKGTFKAVIKYAGDSCYKSVSKTIKITVKK